MLAGTQLLSRVGEKLRGKICKDASSLTPASASFTTGLEEEQVQWVMKESLLAASSPPLVVSAISTAPPSQVPQVGSHGSTPDMNFRKLQEQHVKDKESLEKLNARLAATEEELQDTKLRCKALEDSLQVAQALRVGAQTGYAQHEEDLVPQLFGRIAELEARIGQVASRECESPAVIDWLDGIKPGYGTRFAKCFQQAGYEDLEDISNIPRQELGREVETILHHVKFSGGKLPQQHQIADAILRLNGSMRNQALDSGAAASATTPVDVPIEEWLDGVRFGFGSRFANAFAYAGYETIWDLTGGSLSAVAQDMRGIRFQLHSFGAKPPQVRLIMDAVNSILQTVAQPVVAQPKAECVASEMDEEEQLRWAFAASIAVAEPAAQGAKTQWDTETAAACPAAAGVQLPENVDIIGGDPSAAPFNSAPGIAPEIVEVDGAKSKACNVDSTGNAASRRLTSGARELPMRVC